MIEGLEETKRIATDIGQKAELARVTQVCTYLPTCLSYLRLDALSSPPLLVLSFYGVRLTPLFLSALLVPHILHTHIRTYVYIHDPQANIRITSEKYRPVANRSSLLFFLMNDLVKIHTYYIYSLAAFTLVFYRGIDLVPLLVSALL